MDSQDLKDYASSVIIVCGVAYLMSYIWAFSGWTARNIVIPMLDEDSDQ